MLPLPVPAMTMPRAPAATSASIAAPRAPALLLTMSTLRPTCCVNVLRFGAVQFRRHPITEHAQPAVFEQCQRAGVAAVERIQAVAVHLSQIDGADQAAAEHRKHSARTGLARHAYGVEQVLRAFVRARCGRPHRRGQHQRLGGCHRALQEVGRFFQRIGAVRDHDAGNLVPRQAPGRTPRQQLLGGMVDVGTVDAARFSASIGKPFSAATAATSSLTASAPGE